MKKKMEFLQVRTTAVIENCAQSPSNEPLQNYNTPHGPQATHLSLLTYYKYSTIGLRYFPFLPYPPIRGMGAKWDGSTQGSKD